MNAVSRAAFRPHAPPRRGLQRWWLWRRYRWRGALLLGAAAVFVLVLLLAAVTVRALARSSEDHAILEQVRLIEVVSERLFRDAAGYHDNAPRNFEDYARDTRIYYTQLRQDRAQLDDAVAALAHTANRDTSGTDAVAAAIDALANRWHDYARGLDQQLGPDPDEPRLEWATSYLVEQSPTLRAHVDGLASAAMTRAEARLQSAQRTASIAVPSVVGALLLYFILLAVALERRVARTVASCRDLAQGRFGAAPHYRGEDDLSPVDHGIAAASERIAMSLALIDSLQQARNLPDLLDGFRQAAARALPLDWIGLYFVDRKDGLASRRGVSGVCGALPACLHMRIQPASGWIDVGHLRVHGPSDANAGAFSTASGALWMPSSDADGFLMLLGSGRMRDWPEADRTLLSELAPLLGHGLEKSELTERLLVAAVSGLAKLAESRDPETGNHLLRMSECSRLIAIGLRTIGGEEGRLIDDAFVEDIHRFAPMHDIGKVGVPDAILKKPGALDAAELVEMRRHPVVGGEVLRLCREQLPQIDATLFQLAIDIAEAHHEKFDGSGYPYGLRGKDIPLAGRIVAAADVIDALASRRPYKEPWPMERVWQHMIDAKGSHFDPEIVDAALAMREQIEVLQARHGHV